MVCRVPDFMQRANNVYRTKCYIVKQVLQADINEKEFNAIKSFDTFYARTKKRDKQYEKIFVNKKYINGKRLPSTMFSRKYIK